MSVWDIKTGKQVPTEDLVGTKEAAKILGVHVKTVEVWSRSELIPIAGRTAGGHRRYRPADLIEWIERDKSA